MARKQEATTIRLDFADNTALGCFFISGFVALLYEICWIRKATLVFGTPIFAVSSVVAVFLAGMAVGSYVAGRYALRLERPLRAFALIELFLGLLGLSSLTLFDAANSLFKLGYEMVAGNLAWMTLLRLAVITMVVVVPTVLMGATLPLLSRQYVRQRHVILRSLGLLYGWNTLGAAAGCMVTGLFLIPHIGVSNTVRLGAALNLAVAILIWFSCNDRRALPAPAEASPHSRPPSTTSANRVIAWVMLTLFLGSGAVAVANEILWTRFLSLILRNTVHTYTLSLAVVLLGIVAGSALSAVLFNRLEHRAFVFGLLQVVSGIAILTVLTSPLSFWATFADSNELSTQLGVTGLIFLAPAVLSGASFPLAIRIVVDEPALAALGIGRMTAANTLGGVLGALAMGLFILPSVGLQTSLMLMTGLSLVIGFAAWLALASTGRLLNGSLILGSIAVWAAVPLARDTRIPADFLARGRELVDYREGLTSHLAVVKSPSCLNLEIDRLWQGRNRKCHQILAAHVPMMLHPDPKRIAVIGVGTGQTSSRFLMYDIDRLDCVDLEGRLVELLRKYFDSAWMDDPRTHVTIDDGRSFLSHVNRQFDVITLEAGQIFRPGVASFYTRDFYELAHDRLHAGGVICQMVPLAALRPAEFRTVINTFLAVFPDSVLWYNTAELLLVGRRDTPHILRADRLAMLASSSTIRDDLQFAHWGGPPNRLNQQDVFLSGFLMGPENLRTLAGNAPIYGDDRPYLEYTTTSYLERAEIPLLALIRPHLEPVSSILVNPQTYAEDVVSRLQSRNLDEIAAAAFRRTATELPNPAGTPDQLTLLREALRWNAQSCETQRLLGDALLASNRVEEAVSFYKQAVQIDPEDAIAHHHLARALHVTGRIPDAVIHYRRSIRLNPTDAPAHNNLAGALTRQDDWRGALRHLLAALRLDANFANARTNLMKISPEYLNRWGGSQPDVAETLAMLTDALERHSGPEAIRGLIQKCMDQMPRSPEWDGFLDGP